MENFKCIDKHDKRTKRLFLALPQHLYKDDSPQSIKTEKALLCCTHPLSKDAEVFPLVVINQSGEARCRCLLTYYPNDPIAYVGFFEAYNDISAVKELFQSVEEKAASDGKTGLLGPIDVSIYIGYRFKANLFDKTYTSEPYNKDYYPDLWQRCGFTVRDRYISNKIRKVRQEDIDPKLQKIYDRYTSRGYQFITPKKDNFKECMSDVYKAMMELYSGFSGFKPISEAQYMKLFLPLRKVLNLDMVKLVYRDGRLRAFCIAIPNYRELTLGKLTLVKLIKIMKIKKSPDEYVVLYMGAERSSCGLGGALAHCMRNSFYELQCTSIGALIKEGGVTAQMYDTLYTEKFEYVLLSKKLKDRENTNANAID